MSAGSSALILTDVEKQYGGLRPLRVRGLRAAAGRATMLLGFDRPAAETLINLITGAALPDKGEVISLGRPTQAIADSEEWLSFVEQFGIVSDRIALLEGMSLEQNLALPFDLELDPVPGHVLARVTTLAAEVGVEAPQLAARMADVSPLLRSRVHLARALALDPAILVLEHPSANLIPEDAKALAGVVRHVTQARALTTVGLLMDEEFAKATGGRLLFWQPATGEMRERSSLRFW
jgi:ABC-type lipoprotein export system ATPase subunit